MRLLLDREHASLKIIERPDDFDPSGLLEFGKEHATTTDIGNDVVEMRSRNELNE